MNSEETRRGKWAGKWTGSKPDREESGPVTGEEFEAMVAAALDDLPEQFRRILEKVPVVVSDRGWERRAYGLYQGGGIARDNWHDRITIFQDTLVRDFGYNRRVLAAQVERTVRHELGHHLGFHERGVSDLGL